MKSAAVALQCSGVGAPEVVQHFYQIFFRVGILYLDSNQRKLYICRDPRKGTFEAKKSILGL